MGMKYDLLAGALNGMKYDLLAGALKGAGRTASAAYGQQQSTDIAKGEAPYNRMVWQQMVDDRKAKILAQQRETEAAQARTRAYEADLKVREQSLKDAQTAAQEKAKIDESYQRLFGPMVQGSMQLTDPAEVEKLLKAGYSDTYVARHPGTKQALDFLQGRLKDLQATERARVNASGRGSKGATGGGRAAATPKDWKAAEEQALADYTAANAEAQRLAAMIENAYDTVGIEKARAAEARAKRHHAAWLTARQNARASGQVKPPAPAPATNGGDGGWLTPLAP